MHLLSSHPQGLEMERAPECASSECRGYEDRPRLWVVGGIACCLDCAIREAAKVVSDRLLGARVTDYEVDQAAYVLMSAAAKAKATGWSHG